LKYKPAAGDLGGDMLPRLCPVGDEMGETSTSYGFAPNELDLRGGPCVAGGPEGRGQPDERGESIDAGSGSMLTFLAASALLTSSVGAGLSDPTPEWLLAMPSPGEAGLLTPFGVAALAPW